jgi:hypothetical protein
MRHSRVYIVEYKYLNILQVQHEIIVQYVSILFMLMRVFQGIVSQIVEDWWCLYE